MTKPAAKSAPEKGLREALLRWYDANRRDLPWRRTSDPYAIWISEIMLQQTRVAAVIEYYERFMKRFPTVAALACAEEAEVLAAWSGLGYYRRARMLHAAAKKIVAEFGGRLPQTSAGLRALPGIGRYTSAAIASIAFGEATAVVDGNVERVLERMDAKARSGEQVWQSAQAVMDTKRAGDWNQAMMELGATICTPTSPRCHACPVKKQCAWPGEDIAKAKPERKKKERVYGLAKRAEKIALVQRDKAESLMASMWELPELKSAGDAVVLAILRHSITDSDYTVQVVELKASSVKGAKWFSAEEISHLPITGLTRKALQKLKV